MKTYNIKKSKERITSTKESEPANTIVKEKKIPKFGRANFFLSKKKEINKTDINFVKFH